MSRSLAVRYCDRPLFSSTLANDISFDQLGMLEVSPGMWVMKVCSNDTTPTTYMSGRDNNCLKPFSQEAMTRLRIILKEV